MRTTIRRMTAIVLVLIMTGLLAGAVLAEETVTEELTIIDENLTDAEPVSGEEGETLSDTGSGDDSEVSETVEVPETTDIPESTETPETMETSEPTEIPTEEKPAEISVEEDPVETFVEEDPVETPAVQELETQAPVEATGVIVETVVTETPKEEVLIPDSPAVLQEVASEETVAEEEALTHTHTPVAYEDVPATPFKKGQKGGTYCSDCGEEITAPTELPYTELTRTLAQGMKGDDVLALQEALAALGYLNVAPDGIFGGFTTAAVNIFQAENGLTNPDGMVGNWTTNVLRGEPSYYNLSFGMNNAGVLLLQKYLKQQGFLDATPDGIFGGMTRAALTKFQMINGLSATGTADINTFVLLARGAGASFRVLEKGMSGTDVKNLQTKLQAAGYFNGPVDGSFGATTEAAVKLFQAFNGLANPDGKVGNWTYGVLAGSYTNFSDLSKGNKGSAVKLIQNGLKSKGYLTATPDGIFGNQTLNAVKLCQQMFDLSYTGIVDLDTAMAILTGTAPVTSTGLQRGDSGSEVLALQQKLYALGYLICEPDGVFGGMTYAAVCVFQAANGLSVPDGKVGTWTQEKLNSANPIAFSPITPSSSKAEIMAMQREMYNYGYVNGVDGYFGNHTETAVKQVQKWFGLPQTGTADMKTLYYLFNINSFTDNTYNVQNYYSGTGWLIFVNAFTNRLYLYSGYTGNWKLYASWAVDTGRDTDPTVLGEYYTSAKGYEFGEGYSCYYYTSFYGAYLMHSTLYSEHTFNRTDSRLGLNLSAGCVRMDIENAKWIYYNIPLGTKVVVVR